MPIPFEAVRYHLGARSAVDADQDGVFLAAGDVHVGRKDFEHVELVSVIFDSRPRNQRF